MWQHYLNLSGNSGVYAYLISEEQDLIEIIFNSNKQLAYIYSDRRPGQRHVQQMIDLAKAGQGLATYINRSIRKNFFSKRRV